MRVAILSGGLGWHVRDLQRAAGEQGCRAEVLDFRRVHGRCGAGPNLLDSYDAIIVRTMPPGSLEQVVFRMDLLHRAEQRGILVLNPARSLETCIDKYLATVKLEAAGLPVPRTVVCQTADDAMQAFAELGGDVVVKPLFGSEGRGMVRVSDEEIAWRTFRTLERTDAVLYVQEFIHHAGWDLRVFVLGEEVKAAMRRWARSGWRTNVAQGGRAESVPLASVPIALALRAARACGTLAAGVDLLPTPEGSWLVLEVNAVPGWRALGPVTGHDIASDIVRFLRQRTG
ncbi:MAG: RimK family alpha-L-glutamate ligase [Gemmataceae bacterium]|nr:RimK family alpha-L-glutamate ligase [Gemmataceae bacterium]